MGAASSRLNSRLHSLSDGVIVPVLGQRLIPHLWYLTTAVMTPGRE